MPDLDASQQDAYAYLQSLLREWGLESLADWAYGQVVAGNSPTMIGQMLYDRPEFRQRFGVIFDRQARGLAPISPAEVIAYERQARQLMRGAGMPAGFYDGPDDFRNFLLNDVSLSELNDRLQSAVRAAYETPPDVRDQLQRLYAISANHVAAYWLDPNRALPLIEQQFLAAQNAAAAGRSGYGQLGREEAERLAGLGVTGEQAAAGFGKLFEARELFGGLPGEGEGAISRSEQLGAVFGGDAAAQERLARRARARRAVFEGGGGFATTREGFGGLGVASG